MQLKGKFKRYSIWFSKLAGFLIFSLAIGVGLGYLGILYFNSDLVHRSATVGSPVHALKNQRDKEKLPFLVDTTLRNVIIFIGDGMGLNQITATRYRYYGSTGSLYMETMPVTGLIYTFAKDGELITDSGAGGTALVTGNKTAIGMLGMTPDKEIKASIMETLQTHGYQTGLITSSDITDATPAAFASHVASREMKLEIARQMIENKINVLVSGGETFHGKELKEPEEISLAEFAQDHGYHVIDQKEAFFLTHDSLVLALFEGIASDKLADEITFNKHAPTLKESTQKAIDPLKDRGKGFMLMVEEEGIDTGSHINRIDFVTQHLKNFDDAIKVALDFALKDKQTLVLVLADHETGGLTIVEGNTHEKQIKVRWPTRGHTGQPIPLLAFGPYATSFTGVWDNTDFSKIIAELMHIQDFPKQIPE